LYAWPETGFFPKISFHHRKTAKNPVSLVYLVVCVARNRVFSENIVPPPKNCKKPGFFSLFGCMRGQKPGFFRKYRSTTEKLRKTRFLEFLEL